MSIFKKHTEAVIGVIIYLILLIVLLLFLGLYKPNPIPPEEGIILDFGGSGSGSQDPGPSNPKSSNSSSQNENSTNLTPNVSNMTQDYEESVSVPSNPNVTESTEQNDNNVQEEEEEAQTVNETVSNLLNTNWNSTSDSDADGSGNGNPGNGGDGDGGSGGGDGEGSGNVAGNGWSLAGRSARSLPAPSVANCDGYVIVEIEVDRTGKVIYARQKPGGCTACDINCVSAAVNSAKKARFNPDAKAKVKQSGTITYNFRPA
jgi:colicin import membrane protein